MGISLLAVCRGWFAAFVMYVRKPELPGQAGQAVQRHLFARVNKYWIDELYNALVVRPLTSSPASACGGRWTKAWWTAPPMPPPAVRWDSARIVRRLQSGNIRSYAGWLAGGAAAIILLMYFGFGTHWMAH